MQQRDAALYSLSLTPSLTFQSNWCRTLVESCTQVLIGRHCTTLVRADSALYVRYMMAVLVNQLRRCYCRQQGLLYTYLAAGIRIAVVYCARESKYLEECNGRRLKTLREFGTPVPNTLRYLELAYLNLEWECHRLGESNLL